MSCIPRLLALKEKTDGPLYSFRHRNGGAVIEGGGEYRGHHYLITFTSLGHRCGYVAIPKNHKVLKGAKHTWDVPIEVHGGVTYADEPLFSDLLDGGSCNEDDWVGFDCAHYLDLPDHNLAEKLFDFDETMIAMHRREEYLDWGARHSHKNYEYVELECKKIIDQLRTL